MRSILRLHHVDTKPWGALSFKCDRNMLTYQFFLI